jgi:hypothetical protein
VLFAFAILVCFVCVCVLAFAGALQFSCVLRGWVFSGVVYFDLAEE